MVKYKFLTLYTNSLVDMNTYVIILGGNWLKI